MNWFMPALVNMSVGSPLTTIGAEGTILWPFEAKKSRNCFLISFDVIYLTDQFKVANIGNNTHYLGAIRYRTAAITAYSIFGSHIASHGGKVSVMTNIWLNRRKRM